MMMNHRCALFVLSIAAIAMPVAAQQQQPRNIQRIWFFRVKPDRAADFEAVVKEYTAVLKKGSAHHDYTGWVSLTGDREYARVDLFSKWAELDSNPFADLNDKLPQLDVVAARISGCVESQRTVITVIQPELSLPFGQGPLPPLISVT
jgi:hypothetical protein